MMTVQYRPTLAVLIYHRVLRERDPLRPYEVDRRVFERQLRMLTRWYTVLDLHDAINRLVAGTLPWRSVAISFDDGYRDNYEVAMPLLRRYRVPATFFVATGYTGGKTMFNDLVIEAVGACGSDSIEVPALGETVRIGESPDERCSALAGLLERVKYLPPDERRECAQRLAHDNGVDPNLRLMMTAEEIREMRRSGMSIGAHTVTHPILARMDEMSAQSEIVNSKSVLEDLLGEEVPGFAYPNGRPDRDFGQRDVEIVRKAGFRFAVTTRWAAANAGDDRYQVPRISLGTRTGARPALSILKSKLVA